MLTLYDFTLCVWNHEHVHLLSSQEVGLTLTIPIISAGSFGLSCDDKEKLTRLLPPARKVSNFFVHFWNITKFSPKPKLWTTAYIYKQQNISEECFWYSAFYVAVSLYISPSLLYKHLSDSVSLPQVH